MSASYTPVAFDTICQRGSVRVACRTLTTPYLRSAFSFGPRRWPRLRSRTTVHV